ncbi:MAG: MotA/TolQ/ExbB proton channel family protein, partial [Novosphingobium sp.]|nr:MotA/TolQ/ExbB proton channel family protein [Novosphingobium sp.]
MNRIGSNRGVRNSIGVSAAALIGLVWTMPAQAMPGVPANLSIGGMFLQADWIVKLVMIGLLIASVVTWTVFVAKSLELRRVAAEQGAIHDAVVAIRSLDDAFADKAIAATPLVQDAIAELKLSADAYHDPEGIKERVVSRFERREAGLARKLSRGVNVLATIGATAPFVGLFGTV